MPGDHQEYFNFVDSYTNFLNSEQHIRMTLEDFFSQVYYLLGNPYIDIQTFFRLNYEYYKDRLKNQQSMVLATYLALLLLKMP